MKAFAFKNVGAQNPWQSKVTASVEVFVCKKGLRKKRLCVKVFVCKQVSV